MADEPIDPSEEALEVEELQYPEFTFDGDGIDADGSFSLSRSLSPEEMRSWLVDLAGGITSHDLGFEADDRRATFGVAPAGVDATFEADDDGRGEIEMTFRFRAATMTVEDADATKVGARGGRGFIPLAMLTDDRDPSEFRCYNWVGRGDEEASSE
ncbi:hypothetical protein [Haloprofundus salinisoli]|uniref:hypothetical protein n=1 Tax=Haloprofundus salinisoli TaxID=2876193 RepID=UPI001CCDEDD8|nr:hypothetical protein [Haloprofundus salinisoli]